MQERLIERKLVKYATATGWLSRKLSWIGRHSAPDRLFIGFGSILFVELKQKNKKPTPSQAREHELLRAAGARVYVIDSVADGIALLDRWRLRNSDDLI